MSEPKAFDCSSEPLTRGVSLLEASAGTGKTYALARIFLRLVAEEGVEVNKILTVTFTTAATEELRERVATRIATRIAAGIAAAHQSRRGRFSIDREAGGGEPTERDGGAVWRQHRPRPSMRRDFWCRRAAPTTGRRAIHALSAPRRFSCLQRPEELS